jgi:hypothetical protein
MPRSCLLLICLSLLSLGIGGCASNPEQSYDYSAFRSHPPRSVLVLPPLNESVEVNAPYIYLSTVTRPLAESGYYVFPVAVIDAYLKDNGLPTPDEMNSIPLDKIAKNIGADAVLYVTIEEWGQKYLVLSSNSVIKVRGRLVDVATGETLWEGTVHLSEGSGNNSSGGLIGMAVAAVVDQIVDTMTDRTHDLAYSANNQMFLNQKTGLLPGPYKQTDQGN